MIYENNPSENTQITDKCMKEEDTKKFVINFESHSINWI